MKKRMNLFTLLVVMFILLALAGCKADNEPIDYGNEEGNSNVVVETDRKLTYNVDITIESTQGATDVQDINDKVIDLEGYTGNSSIDYEDGTISGYIYYRVPTNRLDEFLDFINANDGLIKTTIDVKDITSEYNQVDARLETLEASKAAYQDTLTNGGLTYNEKITIMNKIEDIDTEIALLNKEKASYDNLLDFSMIKITFIAAKANSFFAEYGTYLKNFFGGVLRVIMYLLPVALVGAFGFSAIYFPTKLIRKRRMNANTKSSN